MTRSFYSYAIFFSALLVVLTFSQGLIYFLLGTRVHELHSLANWFVFISAVALICALMMLKYYHHKQYQLAFWTLAINTAASVVHSFVFYNALKVKELTGYFIITVLVALVTGIVYGISLICSRAGEKPWLKAAGAFLGVHGAFLLTSTIIALSFINVRLNGTTAKMEQWSALIGSLGPVLLIMNFRSERVMAKADNPYQQHTSGIILPIAALSAFIAALFFLPQIGIESLGLARNPDRVGENLKALAGPFEARTYTDSHGNTLPYRLMLPLNYDSSKNYPLVVCLHGSSGCGTDNVKQVATSWPAQVLSRQENRTKYPAFLFVPQCPPRTDWGGVPGVPAVDSLVFETILALEKEFSIDKARCYVSGNSMGGYGTWHMIAARPQMFAAAIPISGAGNPALARNIVGIPVWAFHGRKDRMVPVSGSQQIVAAMKNAGGDPHYTEYPNEGHHIWQQVTDTPGLLDWLFAQQRN
jgi:pimeloyl-ACP methyl ester carboxylesterase